MHIFIQIVGILIRMVIEKYGAVQKELHCVCGLKKSAKGGTVVFYEEIWSGKEVLYWYRTCPYEDNRTVVRCAVEETDHFKVEMGLHQEAALSLFLW